MTFWRLFVFISCWIWFTLVSAESFSFPPLRNLQAFNTLVLGNVPLFQTETILTAPEIILHPNANEINKMCVHCIRNCVEITKVRAHLRLSTGGSRPRCSGPPAAMAGCRGGGVRRFLSVPCPDGLGLSLALPCRSLHAGASQGLPLVSPPPLSSPLGAITTDPMASTPSHLRLQPGPLSDSPHLSSQLPTCCLPRDLGLGMSQGGFLQAGLAPVFPTSGSGTNSTRKPRRRPRPLCFSRLPILARVPHCALLCPFPCHLSSQVAVIPHLGYCCTVSTIHSLP